ncbi:hypothetical protein EDC96DRAFT_96627 [Choanephora cucurbitarum]|nr:hypothetical protein EDC96DRAFT_96627 [Choanephora cucurbitarum]
MSSDPLRSKKEADQLLGSFLLQGWVMTDTICSQEGCCFPMMRSKDGSLSFCTHHDQLPNQGAHHNYKTTPFTSKELPQESKTAPVKQIPQASTDINNGDEELRIRRERREQSSKASQLIGQKMLQRWALLNEHCPNSSCYAVPLVRNPETHQMYCVICENIILTEQEAMELENKKKQDSKKQAKQSVEPIQKSSITTATAAATDTPNSKRQKVTSTITQASSNDVVTKLSQKMDELAQRVENCHDPKELCSLFKSIKQCANAIQACIEVNKAMR